MSEISTPYSDNYMIYDRHAHRYVLTEDFVREQMNIDLASLMDTSYSLDISNETAVFLDRVSRMIYGHIYRLCPHRNAKERELALCGELRPILQSAMAEQITYIIFNGDLSLYCAIGSARADTGAVRRSEISPMARDMLINSDIVRIAVPKHARDIEPSYEKEDY